MRIFTSTIGSLLFNLFLPFWTLFIGLLGYPAILLNYKPIVFFVGKTWALVALWAVRFLCGIRYEIIGEENLLDEPYIIACKHQSAFETILLLYKIPKASYVLKKELLKLPVYGGYLPALGMIAVDRKGKTKALKDMVIKAKERLVQGFTVIIFPEGTRTKPGTSNPYHPGIAALYKEAHVPVVPIAINSGLFWGKNSFFKKPGTIKIRILPAIPADIDRKEFMQQLQKTIDTNSDNLL